MAVSSAVGTLVSGPLSDFLKRRKPLVSVASLVIAAAFLPLAIWPSQGTFLAFIALSGLAYGVYIAVDQALMSDVLPSRGSHGKDMGILNIANTAPRFLAPAIAGIALGTGGGYGLLFVIGAGLAALSAVLIGLIRRVR
jgi:MFS family permease